MCFLAVFVMSMYSMDNGMNDWMSVTLTQSGIPTAYVFCVDCQSGVHLMKS